MSRPGVDECYEERWKPENTGSPNKKNRNLPFLAYGFFKPHQIAYSRIKPFVKGKPKKVDVYHELKNVNGLPVLLSETTNYPAVAYIIDFRHDPQYKAYKIIGNSKNKHIYSWRKITVETNDGKSQDVNVLMYPDEEPLPERIKGFNYGNNYDWRNDPVFDATFKYLDWQINLLKMQPFKHDWTDLNPLMGIQSLYMTLWSAIDRFMTFRYGLTQTWNVKELSLEPSFKESLQDNYDAIGLKSFYRNRKRDNNEDDYIIFSTEDLKDYHLNPINPTCSALYYYNLRNNIVHASKTSPKEADIVWNALIGLKKIFHNVYEKVKEE